MALEGVESPEHAQTWGASNVSQSLVRRCDVCSAWLVDHAAVGGGCCILQWLYRASPTQHAGATRARPASRLRMAARVQRAWVSHAPEMFEDPPATTGRDR